MFPYIGKNHPNWLSYFSEGWPNHQPVGDGSDGWYTVSHIAAMAHGPRQAGLSWIWCSPQILGSSWWRLRWTLSRFDQGKLCIYNVYILYIYIYIIYIIHRESIFVVVFSEKKHRFVWCSFSEEAILLARSVIYEMAASNGEAADMCQRGTTGNRWYQIHNMSIGN